jgi:hypothetical protein
MRFMLPSLFVIVQVFGQPVTYPLHIGDIWQYRNAAVMSGDTFVYSYKAFSDTFLGGKTYTVTFFNNNPVSIQRQSGDSVFLYRPGFEKELVYFDFSRTAGDTVSSTPLGNDTMDVVLTHTDVANYFGSSRRLWIFYVNRSRHTIDDEYSVTVADGLGIVLQVPSFGDPMVLVGAVINGSKYGQVVSVHGFQQITPSNFHLSQNFPNPFNPATTISFSLPLKSFVTVNVFDILGREVSILVSEDLAAGTYSRQWNAATLPSGIYFYHIQAGSFTETKKCLLVK